MLKHEAIRDFLGSKMADLKRYENPGANAQCLYLLVWLRHGQRYTRILQRDLHKEKWAEFAPHPNVDPGPSLVHKLYQAFAEEGASLFVLVESMDKSEEFEIHHGGSSAFLGLLTAFYSEGPLWFPSAPSVPREKIPKELFLSDAEEKVLVRLVNGLVVEGRRDEIMLSKPWMRSRFKGYCARLIRRLGDPSSVPSLVQASVVEKDEHTRINLRLALEACTGTREGKELLEKARQNLEAVLEETDQQKEAEAGATTAVTEQADP